MERYLGFRILNEFNIKDGNVAVQYNFPQMKDIDFYNAGPYDEQSKNIVALFRLKPKA